MNRIMPALILLLAVSWAPAQILREPPQQELPEPSRSAEDLDRLRYAASQHEIITTLIEQGRIDQVGEEFARILNLNFTGEDELLVVESAWRVVKRLRELRHFAVAHQIVEDTLDAVRQPQHKYSLYMLQGKTYLDQRLYKDAIRSYQKAKELSRGNNN